MPINAAMRGSPKSVGLGANSEVQAALEDMCSLLHLLLSRPTHVRELVPDMPHYMGYHDAATAGAGEVWFSLTNNMPPFVWRSAFPPAIESEVVSDNNLDGRLTNSDLELAAEVLAVGVVLATAPEVKHIPLRILCDNTPTVSWINKMASKAKGPTARCLLQGLVFMLHCNRAGRLTTVHVKGDNNVMPDVASCPVKAQKLFCALTPLSDQDFLASFDTTFPLPDQQEWEFTEIPLWLRLCIFKTLHGNNWDCDSGWDRTRVLLASMDDALSTVRECCWLSTLGPGHHGQAPHVCCFHAGRKVWSQKSGQSSVS
jgi:hypothetical protein